MTTVNGYHHSGKWDTKPELLAANVKRLRHGRSFGTRTEVGSAAREAALRAGDWQVYRPTDATGHPADCAAEWDPEVWDLAHGYAHQLTTRRVFTRGGFQLPPTTLVAAVLKHRPSGEVLVIGSLHRNLKNTPLRRLARWSEARGLRRHLRKIRADHPTWHIAISYDENSNQRLKVNRGQVRATILRGTGLRNLRAMHAKKTAHDLGTHGRSILDTTLSTCRGQAETLPGDASSDHRPYKVRLDLGAKW